MIGTTVMTIYNNETYRIDDIDETADQSSEFFKKDGTKMTFLQYYKEVCKTMHFIILLLYFIVNLLL